MQADRQTLDLIESCPHCGAPCSGTYRFEVSSKESYCSVEVDQPTAEGLWESVMQVTEYAHLPRLLREWNECRGWCGVNPTKPDLRFAPQEFSATAAAMARSSPRNVSTRPRQFLEALEDLAALAVKLSAPVSVHDL